MLLTELLVDVLCSRGVAQVQRASLCDADDKIISWTLSLLIERRIHGAHWSHATAPVGSVEGMTQLWAWTRTTQHSYEGGEAPPDASLWVFEMNSLIIWMRTFSNFAAWRKKIYYDKVLDTPFWNDEWAFSQIKNTQRTQIPNEAPGCCFHCAHTFCYEQFLFYCPQMIYIPKSFGWIWAS